MNIKTNRDLFWLITYAGLLVLMVLNIGTIVDAIGWLGSLFKPLLMGIAIAFILHKPCQKIEQIMGKTLLPIRRPGLRRGMAVFITYLAALLVLFVLILFIVPQFIDSIRLFASNIGSYLANMQNLANQAGQVVKVANIDLSALLSQIPDSMQRLTGNLGGLLTGIIGVTAGVAGFLANLFIALIFSIYLLAGRERILGSCKAVCRTYLPPHMVRSIVYIYQVTIDTLNKYVYGQLTEALILGMLCFVGMLVLGFDYPVMISTLIGLTALVPMVGAYIGGGVAFLVLLMVSPPQALWFIVFLLILQQIEGNIIYPRVVGSSLGLPGIWVLLAAIVGGGPGWSPGDSAGRAYRHRYLYPDQK